MRHRAPFRPASAARLAAVGVVLGVSACAAPQADCPDGFDRDSAGLCLERPTTSGYRLHEGDLRFTSADEVEQFCTEANAVIGDVEVRIADAEDLDALSCLRRVSGDLRLDDMPALRRLSLPWLEEVGRSLYVQGNPVLQSLELPRLASTGRALAVQYNGQLGELDLPVLTAVGSYVAVYSNGVRRVHFPVLREVGGQGLKAEEVFYVRVNQRLKEIEAPRLAWVAGVVKISSNDRMLRIRLPALAEVGSGVYISFSQRFEELVLPTRRVQGFVYLQHSHLRRFSMPCLEDVVGDLMLHFNEDLTQVDFPRLASVGGMVNIQTNAALPRDQIDALLEQLDGAMGAPAQTMGNGPDTGPVEPAPPCGLDQVD